MVSKLEFWNKEHICYVTSNNPQSAYAYHILDNTHEYGPISTTTALLQSAKKGRRMHILENHFIQLFQHNNVIINELLNWCTSTATSRMRLQISTHTPLLTFAQRCRPESNIPHRKHRYVTTLTNVSIYYLKIKLFIYWWTCIYILIDLHS